jgi:hypothetical protein
MLLLALFLAMRTLTTLEGQVRLHGLTTRSLLTILKGQVRLHGLSCTMLFEVGGA